MATAAVLPRHQLVFRDPAPWPFLWRGLLPLLALCLLALLAVGPFAHRSIEGTVARELRLQLDAAGFGWVQLEVSGQQAHLSGTEPAAGAGETALSLARAASCPTWLGSLRCTTAVTGSFAAPVPPPPPPSLPAPAVVHPAAPAPLTREGCEGSLASLLASEQIEFAPGSAKIDARSNALLDRLAREVRACPGRIRVEGYTDTIGRGRLNQRLSADRASAVRTALITRGVPPQRLVAKGYGARRAIADNSTEAGRARNRRIEFHTLSK